MPSHMWNYPLDNRGIDAGLNSYLDEPGEIYFTVPLAPLSAGQLHPALLGSFSTVNGSFGVFQVCRAKWKLKQNPLSLTVFVYYLSLAPEKCQGTCLDTMSW